MNEDRLPQATALGAFSADASASTATGRSASNFNPGKSLGTRERYRRYSPGKAPVVPTVASGDNSKQESGLLGRWQIGFAAFDQVPELPVDRHREGHRRQEPFDPRTPCDLLNEFCRYQRARTVRPKVVAEAK